MCCGFCGGRSDGIRKFFWLTGIGKDGGRKDGQLCDECLRTVMIGIAIGSREKLDGLVEEVRTAAAKIIG
jgi:hypothetical protein